MWQQATGQNHIQKVQPIGAAVRSICVPVSIDDYILLQTGHQSFDYLLFNTYLCSFIQSFLVYCFRQISRFINS